jgi:hypothetical protein
LQNDLPVPHGLQPVWQSLLDRRTPAHWCVHVLLFRERFVCGPNGEKLIDSGLSVPSLSKWNNDLQRRAAQLREWAENGVRRHVWIGGVSRPAALFDALRQAAARTRPDGCLDNARLVFEVRHHSTLRRRAGRARCVSVSACSFTLTPSLFSRCVPADCRRWSARTATRTSWDDQRHGGARLGGLTASRGSRSVT